MLLEGIETLLVLSKHKTMSKAGSQLYISSSAVSKRISNLEKRLNKKLVEPNGRQVRLTPEAQKLIESIGPSFLELQGRIFDQQSIPEHTPIVLDCSETLIAGYIGENISLLKQVEKTFKITTNHTPRIVENIQSGRATIGICAGFLPSHHGLKTYHLLDEPFYVVSTAHLEQLPERLICNDLSNPANSYQLPLLSKVGITPAMEMDSYTAAAKLALGGLEPALVPYSIIKALSISDKNIYQFEGLKHLYRPVYICVRINSEKNQRVKTMIQTIGDAVPKAIY
ncbi:LysR family transcriptional regulator [Vibrio gallicus]|uniref:LysR family transcriptional regulator n=1 Tax=Vibrio gallicus TaxID=190897 RepID=UPI0021C4A6B7|nr:LysR family transcriptional regulator [Vibrio gallicus]